MKRFRFTQVVPDTTNLTSRNNESDISHSINSANSPNKKFEVKLNRQDKFGNPIVKGMKQHRISFKKKMKQIFIVENWKIHNYDTGDDDQPCCPYLNCNVF